MGDVADGADVLGGLAGDDFGGGGRGGGDVEVVEVLHGQVRLGGEGGLLGFDDLVSFLFELLVHF